MIGNLLFWASIVFFFWLWYAADLLVAALVGIPVLLTVLILVGFMRFVTSPTTHRVRRFGETPTVDGFMIEQYVAKFGEAPYLDPDPDRAWWQLEQALKSGRPIYRPMPQASDAPEQAGAASRSPGSVERGH